MDGGDLEGGEWGSSGTGMGKRNVCGAMKMNGNLQQMGMRMWGASPEQRWPRISGGDLSSDPLHWGYGTWKRPPPVTRQEPQ